ncbi:MAG: M14 metallopeptidase family protein [Bacteroidota bacterium]
MKRINILFFIILIFNLKIGFTQTQSPSEYLGYDLGERFTRHFQVVNYFNHVVDNNDNVKLIKYGETYEHRPLHFAVIASPKNFSKLEDIRLNHLRSAGLLNNNFTKDGIAIVWLSYNVHGNESVSTEVSMKTIYELVNPDNQRTKNWLENTIVIIDPCLNPDGRERYINWYYQKGNMPYNTNPDVVEHHEPWPGGRYNHYLFDLNRDWAWTTQTETQNRIKAYNKWLPHVHVDFHEQGVNQPYYFAPAAEPYHDVISDFQREFQLTVGKNNAKYFDKNGWLYFTKEFFDLLYPSYGDSYPMYNGAVGMTYEQGGSGRAGLGIINDEEDELSLKDRIAHHYTSSLSTIEISSLNAEKLSSEFQKYYKNAAEKPNGQYKSYIVKNDNGNDKISSLIKLLDRHQIEYGTASSNVSVKGINYKNLKTEKFKVNGNDLIISAYQPKSNLVKALFEPQTILKDSLTYDITAWSLPYARGLNAYATSTKISTKPLQIKNNLNSINEIVKPYAYVAKWNSIDDVSFLSYLLQKKIKVRFSKKPFTIDNKDFAAGSLVITRTGNHTNEDFDEIIKNASKKFNRNVLAVATGFVSNGNDFGSRNVTYLKKPKIAVLSGNGTSSLGFGAVWHFFEQQIHYPINVIDTDYFNSIDLHDYDVLILPNGYYNKILTKSILSELKLWINKGGKLIVINSAISTFAESEEFAISTYEDDKEKEAIKKEKDSIKKQSILDPYGDMERNYISNLLRGSIFKATLDNTNPLGFGYSDFYYTLKTNNNRYTYLKDGYNVSVIKDKSDLLSGFAGKNAIRTIDESLVYGVERKGRGTIVYLVDDPLFRSFWENGKLLFSNAVFMVGL